MIHKVVISDHYSSSVSSSTHINSFINENVWVFWAGDSAPADSL